MTHIDNIPHIIQNGVTHKTSIKANSNYKPIGDSSIINTRNSFILSNGNPLGKYIPFYFGGRMPMLFVIQNGYNGVNKTRPEDIVYIVSSVQEILHLHLDFVFTDGHAIDSLSRQFSRSDIDTIFNVLDFDAIQARYWKDEHDLDLKRRKEAELLIMGDVDKKAIIAYFVFNQSAYDKMLNFGAEDRNIYIKPNFYF